MRQDVFRASISEMECRQSAEVISEWCLSGKLDKPNSDDPSTLCQNTVYSGCPTRDGFWNTAAVNGSC